ncbi:TIMELESS-interacting protein-like [Acipenser oxyrinchus oxyrinchus]|uniref:TIMELESS-interacting protein n=1 Tax=Acipenser oxyrinchus oxyrinchus TaxID=40147 RepID=A0AAD8CUI0_ACIOX|nr:TIMELESS-interacting protein-like [Acipenser oxyrinchus oxyrinchus]
MDPLGNSLSDMPAYENTEDEQFPPLSPPLSPRDGDPFATDDDPGEVSKLDEAPVAKRRSVKRPQPKLDSQRLISERGLPALRTMFNNVRFKGKGHEAEDLKVLMQHMEHWAHRLYPKLQFEDFIDKLEVLGNKKEVQTCLKRIRLDMPLTHEDFMTKDDAVEDEELNRSAHLFEDSEPFLRESQSVPVVQSTPSASSSLTEEQRQRIERNKQLALERRLAKLQQDSSQSRISNGISAQPPVTQSTPAKPTDPDELDSEMELESLDLDTVVVKHTNSTCEQGWELKEGAAPVCADSLKEGDPPVCADSLKEGDPPVCADSLKEGDPPVCADSLKEGDPPVCADSLKEGDPPVCADSLKEGDPPVCADSLKEGDPPVCADSLKEGDAPVCADSLKESASTEEVSASVPEDQQKVNGIEQDTD